MIINTKHAGPHKEPKTITAFHIRRCLSMHNSTEHADPYQEPKTITSFIEKGRSF